MIPRTGWMVTDWASPDTLLELCDGAAENPPARVLLVGDRPSVFRSYEHARSAARRTLRYAKRHQYPWGRQYRIIRVGVL